MITMQQVQEINAILRREEAGEPSSLTLNPSTKYIGYKAQYVLDAVNAVLGPGNWRYDVQRLAQGENDEGKKNPEFDVLVTLWLREEGGWFPVCQNFGGGNAARGDEADAYKGAVSDGLKKCFASLSIGNRVYRGEIQQSEALSARSGDEAVKSGRRPPRRANAPLEQPAETPAPAPAPAPVTEPVITATSKVGEGESAAGMVGVSFIKAPPLAGMPKAEEEAPIDVPTGDELAEAAAAVATDAPKKVGAAELVRQEMAKQEPAPIAPLTEADVLEILPQFKTLTYTDGSPRFSSPTQIAEVLTVLGIPHRPWAQGDNVKTWLQAVPCADANGESTKARILAWVEQERQRLAGGAAHPFENQ